MTINKNIFYVILTILALSIGANFYFYSKNINADINIDQSKCRVEILNEMIAAQDSIIDRQTDSIINKQIIINRKDSSLKLMPKYYTREKTNVRSLDSDGKINFLSNRLSKKINN